MNSTGIWDKTRALFLAALMITSVFAGTITLTGAAVAASAGNTATADPGKFQVSVIGADGNADQTFAIDPDTGVITRAGPSSDNKTVGNVNSAEDSSAVIAFAIGNASSDQTVLVGSGTYNGSISIQTSGISLETDDGATIVGDGVNTGSQPHAAIHVDDSSGPVENVTISGFTVENPDGNFGIFAGTGSTNGQNDGISGLVLEDNTIEDISTTVDDSALTGGPAGIGIRGDYGTDGKPGIVIQNNVIDNVENVAGAEPTGITLKSFTGDAGFGFNSSGAAVEDTASPPATNTDILNNEISNISSSDGGFATKGISVSGEFEDVLIAENTLSQITSPGRVNVITLTENSGSFSGNQYDIDGDGKGERIGPRDFEITDNTVNQISAGDGRGINIGGYEDLSGTDGHIIADNNIQNASVTRFAGTQDGFSIGSADALNVQDNDVTPAPGSPALALGNATSVSGNDLNSDSLDVRVSRNVSDVNGQIVQLYEQNTLVNVSIGNGAARETRTDDPGSPTVTNADLLDTDNDGDIDTVNVTFDEPVRDDSLAASDFQIGGQTFDSVSTVADGDAGAYDNKTQLTLDEGNEFDGTSLGNDSFGLQVFGESSTTDLAGNQVGTVDDSNVTDAAEPVVEGVSFSPTVINISNAQQATSQGVTITIEFSEPVQNFSTDDELPFDGLPDVSNAVIQSVNEETVTATADVGSLTDQDNLLDLAIVDEFQDNAGNAQIAFEQSNEGQSIYEIDVVRPDLASNTITTIDSDNDGTVDQLEVEFNDNVSDSSVEPSDFTVSDPSATVESVDTGDVANDNIVILNVSGVPVNDTSVTPDVTVADRSIEDTAGNEGPDGDTTQESVDGAAPVVTELTVDDTGDSEGQTPTILINESDTPAPIQVQVDFSETLTSEPTADVLNADGSSRTSTSTAGGTFNGDQITFDLDSDISDNNEETSLFVEVSDASDDSSNTLETFNESRITVDTLAPSVSVDDPLRSEIQDGTIDLRDNVTVDTSDVDTIEVAVDDGDGLETVDTVTSVDELNDTLESFDTTQFNDGTIIVQVNVTDQAGNFQSDSGSAQIDNEAPTVEIESPQQTTLRPTGGELDVDLNISESNLDTVNVTLSTRTSASDAVPRITSDPAQAGADSATHTVAFEIPTSEDGSSLNNVRVDYSNTATLANPSTNVDVSNVTVDNVTVTLNGTDVSENITGVSASNNDATLDINFDGSISNLNESATVRVTIANVSNSNAPTDVGMQVNQQSESNDEPAVARLDFESGQVASVTYTDVTLDPEDNVTLAIINDVDAAVSAETPDAIVGAGFTTQELYELSVNVTDETGKTGNDSESDALLIDNTPPENLNLIEPNEKIEFPDTEELQVAYAYTENKTGSVEVQLSNDSLGESESITVDESQYVNDDVVKSFGLDLDDAFGASGLDDGLYNVTILVTDSAGNTEPVSATNVVAINNDGFEAGDPQFNEGPTADATIDAENETVTVDVTYNISVPEVTDAGDLDQTQDELDSVQIDATDIGTLTIEYYDAGNETYETEQVDIGDDVADANNTAGVSVEETLTINLSEVETPVDQEDRVLDRSVALDGDSVTVTATDTAGDEQDDSDSVSGDADLFQQPAVEPRIESVEVDGADTPSTTLEIEFTRPIKEVRELTQSDFAYQDVSDSGANANFVTEVTGLSDDTVTVTLNENVTAGDVDADRLSLQSGDVLESDTAGVSVSSVAVSPDNGTIEETTAPTISDVKVDENATQVTVTFDQSVEAGDGGNLTAANFTYVDANDAGASGIESAEQVNSTTVGLTLNASATADDVSSDSIEVPIGEVFDQFGNNNDGPVPLSLGLNETIKPSGVEIVAPTDQLIKQSDGTLQISYEYVENIPDGTDEVKITLDGPEEQTFTIADEQYLGDGSLKTIAIDLNEDSDLGDGIYDVEIDVTDAAGNTRPDTVPDVLVINDDAPAVTNVEIGDEQDDSENVAPDETINVSYDYVNPGVNATRVTVNITQAGDTEATVTQSIDSRSEDQTVQVDLSSEIDDNEDYTVSVRVTDESGLTDTAESQADALNVNANKPRLESVETNAGSDTVTVTFSEPVVAADGEVSLDDFAYQDVSDSGASAIESVAYDGDSQREIVLTLDSEVTAEDLGSDLVNVREGALEDTADDNARQVPLNATALADTTAPTVDVTAPDISQSNDDSVPVSVNVGGEETSEVAVTLTGPDGTELSGSGLSPTLDATTLEDGTVTVSVTVTDAGGNTETGQTTVEKDTVRPTIESVTTDVNSDQVTVTFSEPVTGVQVSDFDITSPAHRVESVSDTDDAATVTLVLNASVPADAINNSDVVVSSTATDSLGNAADDESVLTDTGVPVIDSAEVGTNSSTITVDFDEPVEAGDGGALTADNFSYTGAGEIINVSHEAGASTATLVLSEPVTDAELGSAEVTAEDGAVVDLFDNSAVLSETVVDETAPSGVELVEPSGEVLKQSSDLLNVTYRYVENVPSNVDSVDITLTPTDGGESVTYQIDDTEYPDTAANKTLTLDLDSVVESELADGAYTVSIEVTDGSGNTNSASSEDAQVVINDDAPAVSDVSVDSASDVAPDETINVSYDYVNPGVNATSVTVHIVDTDDVSNFTNTDFANATFAQYVFDETERTPGTQTVTVDLSETPDDGSQLADNDDYVVFVTATDESGLSNLEAVLGGAQDSALLDVNANEPTLESVETNAGSNTVTVTFSEPVVAADGEISLDDFSYTDADGTTRIVNADAGGDSVVLTLSNDVDAESLGEDVVNVREDAIEDTDGDNARQVSLNATALADTTAPTTEVSAEDVNAQNADNFQVDVTTEPLSEPTNITVTATGSDGETVNATASVTDDTTVALNVSALADGEVTISVEATDVAGNSGSQSTASTTVTKDTVAPTIESATTNAGTSTVDVTFSEPVTDVAANAFSITSPVHEVDSVSQQDATTVVLTLNRSVPPAAINVSGVQVSATGVSDSVGNDVTNEVNFTDAEAPSIAAVSAERNSSTVTVTFTEVITGGGESQNLTAEDFEYADNSNTSVSGIVSVNKTGPQTAVLTVNGSFTPSDLAEDTVAVAPESVFDTVDNAATSNAVGLGFEASLDASSTNDTVTIRVVTAQNITDAVDSLQVTEQNSEFAELEGFELNDRLETSLNASEFTEVEPGVFETAIELPRDDTYTVSGVVSSTFQTETTTVDTSVPEPTDAVVLEVTSEAQLDDSRETTRLRVLFDEPIDASQISPDDVTVGGLDGEIVAVQDAGAFGAVEVIVEGDLQTGDSPEISIAGSSYTDLNGTQGVENGSTVIHTDVVQLNEGVNLVSVPAASGSLDISELPLDAIESISRYNAETDSFEVFVPGAPNNPFTTLDGGEGYIIRLENGTTASVAINVANEPTGEGGPNSVDLSEGLNLIGHYQEDQQAVTTALSSVTAGQDGQFSDTVFTVLSQDEEAGGFTYESFRAGEFSTMEDGEAYWVFVTEDETYTEAPFDDR